MLTNTISYPDIISKIQANLARVIIGKDRQIELLLAGLLSAGHILLEDIPGTGKTTLVKALALSIGGKFGRIQFTPDLLPTDIIGASIYNPQQGEFHFRPGPIFANILLADEINRASPRTQSALLEAMGEKQITVEGNSIRLERPFAVIATQNPIDSHGTYPLPEAQLDRFTMQLSLGYPSSAEQHAILCGQGGADLLTEIKPIIALNDLLALQHAAANVKATDAVLNYLIKLVEATRAHGAIKFGVSPRGAQAMLATARAHAFIGARDFITPDDIKKIAVATMAHRLVLEAKAKYAGIHKEEIINEILAQVTVPR